MERYFRKVFSDLLHQFTNNRIFSIFYKIFLEFFRCFLKIFTKFLQNLFFVLEVVLCLGLQNLGPCGPLPQKNGWGGLENDFVQFSRKLCFFQKIFFMKKYSESHFLWKSRLSSDDIFALLQATVLEEMPAFPERESSILALLKRKKPGRVPDSVEGKEEKGASPSPVNANQVWAKELLHRL